MATSSTQQSTEMEQGPLLGLGLAGGVLLLFLVLFLLGGGGGSGKAATPGGSIDSVTLS